MNIPLQKVIIDVGVWGLSAVLGCFLGVPLQEMTSFSLLKFVILAMLTGIGIEHGFKLHRQAWKHTGIRDLAAIIKASIFGTLILITASFLFQIYAPFYSGISIITGLLTIFGLSSIRLFRRLQIEGGRISQFSGDKRRVLIIGAGSAGVMIAREMLRHPEAGLQPVGFLDDEPSKRKNKYLGLPVLGTIADMTSISKEQEVQEVLSAIPSISGEAIRSIVDKARNNDLHYRIIPGVFEILSGNFDISQIRDVQVEDLLRRAPVVLNTSEIAGYLDGRTILVTGAGGSIGSEIVRQIIEFRPECIILFGRGENSIFGIQQELHRRAPQIKHIGLIGDVRDEQRLRFVFQHHRPSVVFHAAAHKHVPLMEQAPSEAILNNIIGTRNVVELCLEYGIERLVNVSTDKAVNPTSVMGASKRVAEMVVSSGATRARSGQAFVSVRFGNVLGSRGSVIPTFMTQIRAGGPITITHPEMVRYFMTIPEAARLVLQAGGLAENGKVYVLNMGEPVKITDLAKDVIKLSGARHVDIVYTGMRPGEKLYEELLTASESVQATTHSEIFSAKLDNVSLEMIDQELRILYEHAQHNNMEAIRDDLARLIPENKFGNLEG